MSFRALRLPALRVRPPRLVPFQCTLCSVTAQQAAMADADGAKKRTFRKFSFRGVDLDQLLDMKPDDLVQLFHARARRR